MSDRIVVIILILHNICVGLSKTNYTDLVIEKGGDLQIASLAIALKYLLSFFTTSMWGSLSDSLGRKTVLCFNIIGSTLSYLAMCLLSDLSAVFASSTLLGFSLAIPPVVYAYTVDITPKEKLQESLGILGATAGIGSIIGIPIGGFITDYFGHLAPIQLSVIVCFINLFIVTLLRDAPKVKSVSKPGFMQSIQGMMTVTINSKVRPYMYARLMQELSFGMMNSAYSEILRSRFLLSASTRGIIGMLLGFIASLVQGRLNSVCKFFKGPQRTIQFGIITIIIVVLIIPFVGMNVFLGLAVIWQFAASLLSPLLNTQLSRNVNANQQGALLGASESMYSLGHILGPISTGYLYTVNPDMPFYLGVVCLGSILLALPNHCLLYTSPSPRDA
eukprot:TRINITY_DN1473_c0_g1_i4.p1 TRINITY_DN1473_c0_g1~~TRINITY_DN1473_c0_g1_i4.p1  ORF type:complete len:389 (-),score=51.38 TRINITY_DN1473_c0_g1_i4:24-1190(-)